MSTKVGNVSQRRYAQLVVEGRELVEAQTRAQFALGDHALEIEPLRPHGGSKTAAGEELLSVSEALQLYAEDIGIPYHTLKKYRWVSARWPRDRRRPGVSHHVHEILAALPDERGVSEQMHQLGFLIPNHCGGLLTILP